MVAALFVACGMVLAFYSFNDARVSRDEYQIIPGFGVDDCYVGMSISKLGTGWSPPYAMAENLPTDIIGLIDNKQQGIYVQYFHDTIYAVNFLYDFEDFSPFAGGTVEGIDRRSSASEVLDRLGKPNRESKFALQESGRRYRTLYYQHLGIDFEFLNGELRMMSVYSPDVNLEDIVVAAGKEATEMHGRKDETQQ